MPAYVSDGEIKLMPEEVQAIGRGSIKKGVKIIKSMEKGLRKHKGVKNFLPPKSKPLDKYAGITR
jgi:stage V sporulation protein SpoVS